MEKEIVMYVRRIYCPGVALARDVFKRYNVPYREIDIDADPEMAHRVKTWTNNFSVPTLVIATPGEDIPYTEVLPYPVGRSIKGFDRGPLITEPNNRALENWLHKHGFLDKPYSR